MTAAVRKRGMAVALVAAFSVSLLSGAPVLAAPHKTPAAQKERAVEGSTAKSTSDVQAGTGKAFKGAAPTWPVAKTIEIDPSAPRTSRTAAPATPVSVTSAVKGARFKIETFDREKSRKAGVDGLLFRVSGGAAKVSVDYSSFRWAFGGDWASRLRLVELPECALSTPDRPECRGKPVASSNDVKKGTVTAAESTSSGALMALAAGTSSGSGTYSATSLSPSATWTAGSNTGEFTWNYPLRTPPGLGGPTPALSLAYSSGNVDGRMSATNNQPSWAGEGFEFDSGFIERRYVACLDDMANGARNTVKTGDLCWRSENAVLSMAGRGGELIKDPSNPNRWRLRNDDGTFVERRTGASNGARDGEHWVVTTTDGMQYWFGRGGQSTMTVPVAGNHAGEPCAATLFKDSFCSQAYRWGLEYVVDLHGNTMTYTYAKETNKYARNLVDTDLVSYDRAAYLTQIDYGTRTDRSESAPMQVVFGTADRCLANCGVKDAAHWPDVPWDQECTASPCNNYSPTFWTGKRLAEVTTKTGGNAVEKWTFTHSFPDPGDGTRAGLWLDKISRQGLVGQATSLPDVRFQGIQLSNRVDTHSDQLAAMKWWRLKTIHTETGGRIDVTYSDPDCVVGSRMPNQNALQDNNLRCYPVRWTPTGNNDPIWDFFHKYVVKNVTETDLTGGAVRTLTQYDYVGAPAWHYTDDDGFIKAEDKTWSVWRGYGAVRTMKGDPGEQSLSETRYFRGMHGDKLPSGTRNVVLPAIAVGAVPEVADEDAFAGTPREEIVYNGPGGDEVSATVSRPWQSEPTASRTINGVTVHARHVAVSAKHARVKLDGGRGYRTTSSVTSFDGVYGMQTEAADNGDDAVTGDEKCTITDYVRNTSAWIVGTVSRTRGYLTDCATARTGVGLQDADVVKDDRVYFDNQAFGAAPTKGEVTKTETLKSYVAGTSAYIHENTSEFDVYGRATKVTTPKGATTTAYTPSAGGPVTQTVTTNPAGWATTTSVQPAWGVPTKVVDPNQRQTEVEYDGLGRITSVWMPGRDKSQPADKTFSYLVRTDGPVTVTTKTLNPNDQYVTSYQLFDGLLRVRQTQRPDASGTSSFAVVTDAYYDSAGRPTRTNQPYLSTAAPSTNLFVPSDTIPSQTVTEYDGAGRAKAEILKRNAPVASPGGEEVSRTTKAYAGDRTDVTPPAGGTVTSTFVDTSGRTTELRQYHAGVAAGSSAPGTFESTVYTYDDLDQLRKVVAPGGHTWQYDYDLRGRKTYSSDPDKGVSTSAYSDTDDLMSTTDSRGKTLAYAYDTLGRKTAVHDGSLTGPKLAEWAYDTLPDGTKVNGVLVKSARYVGSEAYVYEHQQLATDYQPVSTNVTIPDSETGLAGTYNYVNTYKSNGSLYTARIPAIGDLKRETMEFAYDALGQVTSQKSGYGTTPGTLVTGTTYTSFGELAGMTLQNSNRGTVDVLRTYDQTTRRLAQIWTSRQTGPTDVAKVNYNYDNAGNVTKIADAISGDNQCFRADHLRRLTEAWTPSSGDCSAAPSTAALGGPAKYWHSYGYNASGDRTSLVEHGTSVGDRTTTYALDPGKHSLKTTTITDNTGSRTVGYTHDVAGNMVSRPAPAGGAQTMTWDVEGRLATSSDSAGANSYLYDADGNRLIRRDPQGSTLYLPGQELRYNATTGAKTATRYHSHGGKTVAVRTATGITWMSGDHHGTTEATINNLSQAVSTRRTTPFGEVRGTTGTWLSALDKGFVGGTIDNTGLTHIGAREYDPVTGRFISVDPLMDLADPQQMNGYAYANNGPVTFSDPTGLMRAGAQCGPDSMKCKGHIQDTIKTCCNASYDPGPVTSTYVGSGVVKTKNSATGQVWINGYELPVNAPDPDRLIAGMIKHINAGSAYNWAPELDGQLDLIKTLQALVASCEYHVKECTGDTDRTFFTHLAIVAGIEHGLEFANTPPNAAGGVRGKRYNESNLKTAGVPFCGKNSFAGDTLVLMADGTTKRIEEIEVGDEVAASEPEGDAESHKVLAVIVTDADKKYVDLTIATPDGPKTITTTAHHPFYSVDTQDWIDADKLWAGAALNTPGNGRTTVLDARHYTATLRTHNLSVADVETYYVVAGGTAVLVHNQRVVGACPVNGLPHGKLGEFATRKRLESSGYVDIIEEVIFNTANGTEFRADFVARDANGTWIAVEAKTGKGAVITPNQAVGYPELQKNGAIVGTSKLNKYGIKKGTTVRMDVHIDLWRCPACS